MKTKAKEWNERELAQAWRTAAEAGDLRSFVELLRAQLPPEADDQRNVAALLLEPPTAQKSTQWAQEYERRVIDRWVAALALRSYLFLHQNAWPDAGLVRQFASGAVANRTDKDPPAEDGGATAEVVKSYCEDSEAVASEMTDHEENKCTEPSDDASDEALARLVLDGIDPRIATSDDLTVTYDWTRYTRGGSASAFLPSVQIQIAGIVGTPIVNAIEVSMTRGQDTSTTPTWTRFTPASGDAAWGYAKHSARVASLMAGQLYGHLGRGHVVTALYAQALDNAGTSPVWTLLRPFLHMVREINELGDPLIYGAGGILNEASALGATGVKEALDEVVASENWWQWRRPDQVNAHATAYATAAAAFAKAAATFVDQWFQDHAQAIDDDFAEVAEFKSRLDVARDEKHGAPPSEAIVSVDQLKRLCEHAIFFAAFFHTWTNDQQWDIGANAAFVSFGLRDPGPPATGQTYQDWLAVAVPPAGDAWFQTMLADVLTHTSYGRLGDVLAQPVQPLQAQDTTVLQRLADELAAAGIPLNSIRPYVAI